jgi:fructose-specific component phosphotransferase system IIB-like protein
METISRLTRYRYLARPSAFFITVVLIAVMVSFGSNVSANSESYTLTISSTAGGSVTEPGEGTFVCNATSVVNLTAEAEEGYYFVDWTGDVDTIGNVNAAVTTITMEDDYSIAANFVAVKAGHVGFKPGDWVKYDYTYTGWPAGEMYPDWLKLEFLSVEGTTGSVRFTQHLSDGTQHSGNATVDVASDVEVAVLAGIVIYADRTIGDSVYIAEYGNAIIEGEATRTYARASRIVVYTRLSYNEGDVTFHWDKLTGVMVEISSTYPEFTATARVADTNMWETPATRVPWWTWIIVALVAVGLVVFFVRRRKPARTRGC